MRKVLVPMATRRERPDTVAPLNLVRETYLRQLSQRGIFPLLVPATTPLDMLAGAYRAADGVLLMGGGDLDARLYGAINHLENDRAEPERDLAEVAVARLALADGMPILGICRGCQVLAVASGGTLHQHLPDLGLTEEHGIGEGNGYDHLLVREGHAVVLERESMLGRLLGVRIVMNTGHHQAVASVGSSLRVTGRTGDGVAEFLEHRDPRRFCVGVQGHPEVGGPVADALFSAFAAAL